MIQFLNSIDSWLGTLFEAIKSATYVKTDHLAYYRVVFGILLLCYFLPSWSWLADTPPALFTPYFFSFANLTDNHLPNLVYFIADILAILFILMITLGIRAKVAFYGMFVLSSICYSYYYSFGKIDHHTTILIFTYLIFARTNAGTKFALFKDAKIATATQNNAIALLAIFICFGFFSAGFPKLLKWIDFDLNSSGILTWFYPSYFLEKNQMFLAPYVFKLPAILLECMDYVAAIFEISGLFFLLKGKKYWVFFLSTACVFHLANLLLLNIDFSLNLLAYGIFISAPILYEIFQKYHTFFLKYKNFIIAFLSAIALVRLLFIISDISWMFSSYDSVNFILKNYINLLLWVFAILCGYLILISKKMGQQ